MSASPGGPGPSIYRIDMPCEQAGFRSPPFDAHLKVLPAPADGGHWTLLAHSSWGMAEVLARWLSGQMPMRDVRIASGLSPRALRATVAVLPPVWSTVASCAKVHHLDLGADGLATWFVDCTRDQAQALEERLTLTGAAEAAKSEVRSRPVSSQRGSAVSRRQFKALATAVAMGYYEIPHRIDLRTLASKTGVSLGAISELLRRAEGTIIRHYVDSNLMGWPTSEEDELEPFHPTAGLRRQMATNFDATPPDARQTQGGKARMRFQTWDADRREGAEARLIFS